MSARGLALGRQPGKRLCKAPQVIRWFCMSGRHAFHPHWVEGTRHGVWRVWLRAGWLAPAWALSVSRL